MKTLEKMKRRGLIGQKVRARTRAAAWQRLHAFSSAKHLHALTPCLARADDPGG